MSVHLDISPREGFRETVLTTTPTDVKGDELTREKIRDVSNAVDK